jgi:CRISPR-associated protein Csm5
MKFKITTKTPTFIGKGDFLSPSLDFIVKDNILYFLDITKLQDWIISNRNYKELIKDLTNIILKREGNIYKFFEINKLNFRDFVKYSYQIYFPYKEYTLRKINAPIQNNNGFYIPGSTLKGLIRTALIFKYIEDNDYLNKLKETIKIFRNKIYIGDDIFRVNLKDINTDALRFIQISDSNALNLKNLKIFQFERVTRNNKFIPQLFLGFQENVDLYFEINILNGYNIANIPQYWKDTFKNENLIIKSIQNYILILLEQEKEIVEKITNNVRN